VSQPQARYWGTAELLIPATSAGYNGPPNPKLKSRSSVATKSISISGLSCSNRKRCSSVKSLRGPIQTTFFCAKVGVAEIGSASDAVVGPAFAVGVSAADSEGPCSLQADSKEPVANTPASFNISRRVKCFIIRSYSAGSGGMPNLGI